MNSMLLTVRNENRGSLKERIEHQGVMKKLAEKNARKTIVVFPSGEEKLFDSAMQADRYLSLSSGNVSRWIKQGGPKTGKFKGYSAKLL